MPKFFIKRLWNLFWKLQSEKAINYTESEYCELERFFFTVIFLQFLGYPVPFSIVSFDLLPFVLEEISDVSLLELYNDDIFVKLASNVEGL